MPGISPTAYIYRLAAELVQMPGDPDPERKGGEPPEPEEAPPETGKESEGRPGTDIPNNPE